MRGSQGKTPSLYFIALCLILTLLTLVGCTDSLAATLDKTISLEDNIQNTPTLLSTFTLPSATIRSTTTLRPITMVMATNTATNTPLPSPTGTSSPTIEPSHTASATASATASVTASATASATIEPSATPSATFTPTATGLPTITPSPTITMTATPALDAEIEIEMQPGQTIDEIAVAFGLPIEDLMVYNGFSDMAPIELHGMRMRIPIGEARLAAMHATATAVAEITPTPEDPSLVVLNMNHNFQQRNNCAPATTSMVLNVLGVEKTQFDMAALQKPVVGDVNVTAEEVAVSIREIGMGAYVGINGNIDIIERLLAAGFPVMTEEWMPYDGGMGHFRAIRGYDRSDDTILYNDSYYGAELWRSYKNFLLAWKAFNNKFIVPYHLHQEVQLRQIIGENWDDMTMYKNLRATSQAQVEADPSDAYALWGLGEALVKLGSPVEALEAFEQAIATNALPWRYMWYRYGYFEALNQVGRHEELLTISMQTLNQMGMSEDLRYHRAVAFNALGRPEDARAELQQALSENPRFVPASYFLSQLGY